MGQTSQLAAEIHQILVVYVRAERYCVVETQGKFTEMNLKIPKTMLNMNKHI